MQHIYEGAVGTAKRCRAILKQKFPKTKFSIRSKSYSGGCSVTIDWTDGPLTDDVEKVVKIWESASFDGMVDLKSYVDVVAVDEAGEMVKIHGADYVFCQRSRTPAREAKILEGMKEYWSPTAYEEMVNGPDKYYRMGEMERKMVEAGKL